MNQSTNLTTAAPKAGGSSFSFNRLGKLLRLDFAFHHRQWIQILIGGFLAAFMPVIVSALSGLLFGVGWSANEARVIYLACLHCSFLAVSLGVMISYNQRINAPLSPLYLQIPASATEKYISLLLLTLVMHIITPLLGAIAWTVYMLIWALVDGSQVLALYSEVLRDPLNYDNTLLQYGWSLSLMIAMQLAGYATYLFCIISARKPLRAVLRFMGIGFLIFVVSVLGVSMLMHLLDIGTIRPDDTLRYLVFYLGNGDELSISLLALTIPIYLYAFAMIWLGLRSLRRKQVTA
ncbi:hypothetical protein [uncultured Porphyromonas sp.]|uniref:hypothetical protein n=1 Tax=uncultured Porphyromonas sp. TaxID=159274 RepID=UPI0026352D46|nr:hypothetical protein [uncultured Porphyromonas sp.]